MRTDELRNDLRYLASEMEPFEGDPKRVRGHVQRRRLAIAGGVARRRGCACGAVGAVPRRETRENQQVALNTAKAVALNDLAERDTLVTVPLGGDARSVQAALESSMDVRAYLVLRPGAATHAHGEGDARLIAVPGPRQLSRRPRGRSSGSRHTESPTRAAARRCSTGASSLGTRRHRHAGFENELRSAIEPGSPKRRSSCRSTRRRPRSTLCVLASTADPDVTSVRYLDHAAAYEEFKRMFGDQPSSDRVDHRRCIADLLPDSSFAKVSTLRPSLLGLAALQESTRSCLLSRRSATDLCVPNARRKALTTCSVYARSIGMWLTRCR